MKRALALLLCLLFVSALLPSAFAEEISVIPVVEPEETEIVELEEPEAVSSDSEEELHTEGEFSWKIMGWTLYVYGSGDSVLTGEEDFMKEHVTEVNSLWIGDGVARIGDGCCSGKGWRLLYLYLNPSVKEIGSGAFADSARLEQVIGYGPSTVGSGAFSGCTALQTVEFQCAPSVESRAFEGCTALKKIRFYGTAPEFIEEDAFSGVTATVYLQAEEPSWTDEMKRDYGGALTWSDTMPHILQQPQSLTVTSPDVTYVNIPISAVGPDLRYYWSYYDEKYQSWCPVDEIGLYNGYYILNINIPRCNPDYLLLYCSVRNASGIVRSEEFSLTIDNGRPKILTQPQRVDALEKSTVEFKVEAQGATSYRWQYSESSNYWRNCTTAGCDTPSLSLKASTFRSGRKYRCVLSNEYGVKYTDEVRLNVLSVISKDPVSVGVKAGHTATFTVVGNGAVSYRWQYKGKNGYWRNCTTPGADTDTLTVVGSSFRDGYEYRCKVSNPYCTVTSKAAMLKIVKRPTIKTQPESKSVSLYAYAKFKTVASGDFVSYQWFYRTGPDGVWHKCSGASAVKATLSVKANAYRDGYQYRCKVYNDAGAVWSEIVTLTVAPS